MEIGEFQRTMIQFVASKCAFGETSEGIILKLTREGDGRGSPPGDINYGHIDGNIEAMNADNDFNYPEQNNDFNNLVK